MAEKKANWGKLGGSAKMHGKTGTGTQQPGVSSQEGSGSMGKSIAPQAGPSSAYFGGDASSNKDYAGCQKPGVSAATKEGGNAKFAEGGPASGMSPNRGSIPAQAGKSSAY